MKKRVIILNSLLLSTMPFMIYIEVGENLVNFALSDLLLTIIGVLLLFNIKDIFHKNKWFLFVYFFGLLLSIFISQLFSKLDITFFHASDSVMIMEMIKTIIVAVYFFAAYELIHNNIELKHALLSISLSSIPVIIIGFISYVSYLLDEKYFIAIYQLEFLRFQGTFKDPNLCALYFIMILIISLLNYRIWNNKYTRQVMLVLSLISAIIILLTISRGGLIAAVVAIIVLFILNLRDVKKESVLIILFIITAVFLIINLDYLSNGQITNSIISRVDETLYSGKVNSRIHLIDAAYKMGNDNPILGVGKGGFALNADKYLSTDSPQHGQQLIPHNTLLGFYSQQGIIGVLIFISLPIYILYVMIKTKRRQNIYLLSLYVAFFLHSLTINVENIRFIWYIMGMILAAQKNNITLEFVNTKKISRRSFTIGLSIALSGILVLFLNLSRKITTDIYLYNGRTYEKSIAIDEAGDYVLTFDIDTDNNYHKVEIYDKDELIKSMEFKYAYGLVRETIKANDELKVRFISNTNGWMRIKNAYLEEGGKRFPLYNYLLLPNFLEKNFNDMDFLIYDDEEHYKEDVIVDNNKLNSISIIDANVYKYSNLTYAFDYNYLCDGNMDIDYQLETCLDYASLSQRLSNEVQRNQVTYINGIYPLTSSWEIGSKYLFRYSRILSSEQFKLYGRFYDSEKKLYVQDSYFPIQFNTIYMKQEIVDTGNSEWINIRYNLDDVYNINITYNGWVETHRMNLAKGNHTITFSAQGSYYNGEYSKVRIRDSYLNIVDEFFLNDTMKEYIVDYYADEDKQGISFIFELINYDAEKDIGNRIVLLDNTLRVE